jgi:hypothetical protein
MNSFKRNIFRTIESQALICGGALNVMGNAGYYEVNSVIGTATGAVILTLDSANIPDRFQVIWDGNIVADSLFIGDALPNSLYETPIIAVTSLNKFLYNGTSFIPNGTIAVDYSASDIANSTGSGGTLRDVGSVGLQVGVVPNYPSAGAKASDGNIKLTFNKTTATPTNITIVVIGIEDNTGWTIENLECP